ncbi:GPI-anchored protein-like protein [Cucumis melo var. makuwa]|uniref:GPI-anchored protein-like protein n=1 Tax=Cucumis melo var. makuwa TaxID=1194695 RepID=A0A5D3D448_CUCMM|nr:GPI-anchored protein-like protein [Cucumis melo var. makuwa]
MAGLLVVSSNSKDRSALAQNSKAKCIAEQIAKNWYSQLPCSAAIEGDVLLPSNQSQLPLFTEYSRKCEVNLNHTVDGVILPVHVPNSADKLMLTNCTHSQAPKYLDNATYTSVGLATNEDCLVIALGTDAISGSYSADLMPSPLPYSSTMAFTTPKLGLYLCGLAHGLLLLASLVHLNEDTLFKAMNIYRSSKELTPMNRNSKADCFVKQIAWDFDDQLPLSIFTSGSNITPSNLTQLPNLPDYLTRCNIELNNTKNGLILPLHIPTLVSNLVLHGCTHSQMANYLSKPEFTSIGIGCYEQWAVFAFATDSPTGSFNSAVKLSKLGLHHFYLVSSLLFGLFLLSG